MKHIRMMMAFLGVIASPVCAGNWSGGGGLIIKDSLNPWFIQNTKEATYCIVIDRNATAVTEKDADRSIRKALKYWKEEFAVAQTESYIEIKVATQTFTKIDCDPATDKWADITFQYGYLTDMQRRYIGDVTKYASVAVRTHYDLKTLKGRGFVYFAAEFGPDKLQDPNYVAEPWSKHDNALLFWATLHELGHVFGISHDTGNPESMRFMSYNFIDHILQKKNFHPYYGELSLPQFFKIRPVKGDIPLGACEVAGSSYQLFPKKFFNYDASFNCFGVLLTSEGLEIWAGKDNFNDFKRVGIIKTLSSGGRFSFDVNFYLPNEQLVFPSSVSRTAGYHVDYISGKYISDDGQVERNVSYIIDARANDPLFDGLLISGEYNGRMYSNILEGI